MKAKLLAAVVFLITTFSALAAPPPGYCDVQICNKLSRFSLDPFSHMKDKFGEQCFAGIVPQAEAFRGNRLSSESRWYQGSFNPTKSSVTKVKNVGTCTPEVPPPAPIKPAASASAPAKKN